MIREYYPLFVVVGVGFAAFFLGAYAGASAQPGPGAWEPAESVNVTCYKWVENGSAQVACPSAVGAGTGAVHIDVKPCSEYEYKIDESAPCDVDGGGQ